MEKLRQAFKSRLTLAAAILSALWFVLYFALGAAIFKKMWNTSPALPFIGGVFAALPLTAVILNIYIFGKKQIYIAAAALSPAFALAHFFFFAFVLSKLSYFLISGAPYFITAALAALIAFFVFAFPRLGKLGKRVSAITLSAVTAVICITCLFNATPFYISGGATVFAADDEYMIAFATSHQSIGEVEVGGKTYYDCSNGQNNVGKLHRITIPASELDGAKSYKITTQSVPLNTAYLPSKGVKIQKSYSFRPVDESDGIQIYNLSDTHECISGPARAAGYFEDRLDLLILNGDIINDVSSEYQISLIYRLAHKVTGGRVPVIYTRGNHECNGKLAADLQNYVGSAPRGMYYTYKIGSTLSLLVLDTNNDMSDENPLIRPIANFGGVRTAQSQWIEGLGDWSEGYKHSFVVAHMAYPLSGYVSENCHWHEWARELVELTNGKADLALCGHSHKTDFAESGTPDNMLADYPVLRGSLRSNRYPDREGVSAGEFTGCAIEISGNSVNVKFTNAKGRILKDFEV